MTFHPTPRLALALALIALPGCSHTIKLDPGADDAAVYVNGDLNGSGISKYEVEAEYGLPESFVAKVVPASESLKPYTVTVSREFDFGGSVYRVGTSMVSAASLMAMHYFLNRSKIDNNPNWANEMFFGFHLGFIGGVQFISAPLELLNGFRYLEYYDLAAIHDKQGVAAK
jgi:hypothetical protein